VKAAEAAARLEFAGAALHMAPSAGVYFAPRTSGFWRTIQSAFFVASSVLHYVRWSEEGLEIRWLHGKSDNYTWDQVRSIKVTEFVDGQQGADIDVGDGKKFHVPADGERYPELVSAIQARLWAREGEQK
jgi:hypothetical protein